MKKYIAALVAAGFVTAAVAFDTHLPNDDYQVMPGGSITIGLRDTEGEIGTDSVTVGDDVVASGIYSKATGIGYNRIDYRFSQVFNTGNQVENDSVTYSWWTYYDPESDVPVEDQIIWLRPNIHTYMVRQNEYVPIAVSSYYVDEQNGAVYIATDPELEAYGDIRSGPTSAQLALIGVEIHDIPIKTRAAGVASRAEGRGVSANGETSYADGVLTVADGDGAKASGKHTMAAGNYSQAAGVGSVALHDMAYAWSGVDVVNYDVTLGLYKPDRYLSHATGSYNINPSGGITNFFIGESSLYDYIHEALIPSEEAIAVIEGNYVAKTGDTMTGNLTTPGLSAKTLIVGSRVGETNNVSASVGLCEASGIATFAAGMAVSAKGHGSAAFGVQAETQTDDDYSFVWSGIRNSSISDTYKSHGLGTFNINPASGLQDFYIGATNLQDHITAIASSAVDLSGYVAKTNGDWVISQNDNFVLEHNEDELIKVYKDAENDVVVAIGPEIAMAQFGEGVTLVQIGDGAGSLQIGDEAGSISIANGTGVESFHIYNNPIFDNGLSFDDSGKKLECIDGSLTYGGEPIGGSVDINPDDYIAKADLVAALAQHWTPKAATLNGSISRANAIWDILLELTNTASAATSSKAPIVPDDEFVPMSQFYETQDKPVSTASTADDVAAAKAHEVAQYIMHRAGGRIVNGGLDGANDEGDLWGPRSGTTLTTDVPPSNYVDGAPQGYSVAFEDIETGALSLQSSSNYDPLANVGKFTIMAWVKRTGGSSQNTAARIVSDMSSKTASTAAGFDLRFTGTAGKLIFKLNGSTDVNQSSASSAIGIPPGSGEWHHVAVSVDLTKSEKNVLFFVDGKQQGVGNTLSVPTTTVVIANTSPFTIGNAASSQTSAGTDGSQFIGEIDNVRVFRDWAVSAGTSWAVNPVIQALMNECDATMTPDRSFAEPEELGEMDPRALVYTAEQVESILAGNSPASIEAQAIGNMPTNTALYYSEQIDEFGGN